MKRHPGLIPLSHDHHHGLVEARRLHRAAAQGSAERCDAAAAFVAFFARETRPHFREEEEVLFPLVADAGVRATELVTRALLEHQRLHALVGTLDADTTAGDVPPDAMRRLARTLEEHIRFEERTLFPLIEGFVSENRLARLAEAAVPQGGSGLLQGDGTGPLWGAETEDLNATLLAWPPGEGPAEHVNGERDVLLVVLAGSLTLTVDGSPVNVDAGRAVTVAKGSARAIAAGPDGVRYLSVHTRRPRLQIRPASG